MIVLISVGDVLRHIVNTPGLYVFVIEICSDEYAWFFHGNLTLVAAAATQECLIAAGFVE